MPDVSFMDDVIFPIHISWGSTGGPEWLVKIVEKSSGHEERNTPWSAPLRSYDARYGVRTHDELYEVLELYHVAMGPTRGFRLMDWTDYRSGPPQQTPAATDQKLGTGDGVTTVFPLVKRYKVAANIFDRRISKPFGTTLIAVNGAPIGAGFTVNNNTGNVTFGAAPAVGADLKWGGQFHVPVRFDGKLDQTAIRGPIGDMPSIPLKELRL
jgi:uncharacterized protein (TIGR02217 family)